MVMSDAEVEGNWIRGKYAVGAERNHLRCLENPRSAVPFDFPFPFVTAVETG